MTERRNKRLGIRIDSQRQLPDLELVGYKCEVCEKLQISGTQPYFKAIAEQGEHNKKYHPQMFPAPRLTMVYKS